MNRPPTIRPGLILPCVALAALAAVDPSVARQIRSRGTPWSRHIIDDSSKGADGVKLADVNGDGDLDVLTCEESHPVDGKRRGLGVLWYEHPLTDKAQ